ncbi:EbsA family protein [Solibacillus sp. FSL W8-0474]|uniref:EbsA family protein n=1 Tax=Solibacillus sp. FSL W8-0474 TaxID=2975336 RepID=UPI0030F9C3C8
MKAIGAFISAIFFAYMYYSRNSGTFQGNRFYLGSQGIEQRDYVVGLFVVIAIFIVYFSLTRRVVLTEDEIKIKISVAGQTIKIKNITQVQLKDKNIFVTYTEDTATNEVYLCPRDYKLFLDELYDKAPHLK